jgi:hypothetical protein
MEGAADMRKMKKINGYLVVKFNDRELREWDGTALGNYGVIDAELYTGCLDVDRGAMEYDNAGSIEEAVELARGLESEFNTDEPTTTYTVIKETDDSTEEDTVDPESMIAQWEKVLSYQIANRHYPDITPATARHELYGYMIALRDIGMIDSEKCFVEPHRFEPKGMPNIKMETFAHLPPDKRESRTAQRVYSLGLVLEGDCPDNDCRIYLNIFNMCRDIDEQIAHLSGWPRELLERELGRQYRELEGMYMRNYAVKCYRREIMEEKKPPEVRTVSREGCSLWDKGKELQQLFRLFEELDDQTKDSTDVKSKLLKLFELGNFCNISLQIDAKKESVCESIAKKIIGS